MKSIKLTLLGLLSVLFSPCWAGINAVNGFYIGAGIGAAKVTPPGGASLFSNLWMWPFYLRPYLGYRFTDYFAVEGGYTDLRDSSSKGSWNYGPDHFRLYTIDLAAKFIQPFQNGLSLYGKAGVAFAHQSAFNQTFWNSQPSINSNVNRLLPLVGAGVTYNFTQHIAADLGATYYQGIHPIRNIATVGLGLSYTF